jgi:hypothetical protein
MSLVGMIHECLHSLDLFAVLADVFRGKDLVVAECVGALREDEDYVLVSGRQEKVGELTIWAFHAGGGGRFYEDCLIMDFILPEKLCYTFRSTLECRCRECGAAFQTEEPGANRPQ